MMNPIVYSAILIEYLEGNQGQDWEIEKKGGRKI